MQPNTTQEDRYYDVVVADCPNAALEPETQPIEIPSELLGSLQKRLPSDHCPVKVAEPSTTVQRPTVVLERVLDASVSALPVRPPGAVLGFVTEM